MRSTSRKVVKRGQLQLQLRLWGCIESSKLRDLLGVVAVLTRAAAAGGPDGEVVALGGGGWGAWARCRSVAASQQSRSPYATTEPAFTA